MGIMIISRDCNLAIKKSTSTKSYKPKTKSLSNNIKIKDAISVGVISYFIGASAKAGVIFDSKPQLKNYAEDAPLVSPKTKNPSKSSSITSKTSLPKSNIPVNTNQIEKLDSSIVSPQIIAFPGTVLGIAALTYIAYKVDSDFASFVNKSSLRPSDVFGAGYEPALKDDEIQTRTRNQKN